MNYKSITKTVTFILIPIFIIGLLAYDVLAIKNGGTEASISSLIIASSYKMPFAVFITGFLVGLFSGHLFWRMKSNEDTIEIDKGK